MAELPPLITDGSVTLSYSFTYGVTTYATGAYYGYCAIADVKFEDPNIGNRATWTNSVIAQEIAYASVELDELIHYAYVMPYGGSDHRILQRLREMNAKLALANLYDRSLVSNEPDTSPVAARLRTFVHQIVADILSGAIRWDTPFGDATPQSMVPVYDPSVVASITPSPYAGDSSSEPIFSVTDPGTKFRRNGM